MGLAVKASSYEAYNKLIEMINYQHGSLPLKEEDLYETDILSDKEGYIYNIDTLTLGNLLVELGGGRKYKEEEINYNVGFTIINKINSYIKKGDLLFKVYSKQPLTESLIKTFKNTITTSSNVRSNYKEIYKIL